VSVTVPSESGAVLNIGRSAHTCFLLLLVR